MSLFKNLFIPLFAAGLLSLLLLLTPMKNSYADVSVSVRLGQHLHSPHNRHGYGHRHYRYPTIGISGHRSFGLDPRLNHYRHHAYKPHRYYRHYDTSRYRHRPSYYAHRGSSVTLVAPIIYSQRYRNVEPVRSYSSEAPQSSAPANTLSRYADVDGWEALSRYESTTAINAFKAQSSKDPKASLPKIGFALATALQGEPDKAVWALDLALKADTSDLRYFSADPGLQLVLEDLLENYQNAALMQATLLYLKQDYAAAEQTMLIAINECDNCTGTRNLQRLIQQRT